MVASSTSARGTPLATPAQRADAARNRKRILEAARDLFAREGLGVSMNSVARAATVGKATLFRHFRTAEDLIDAVFADHMEAYVAATHRSLEEPDGWLGFVSYIRSVCDMQAADRGFADVLTLAFRGSPALEERRTAAYAGFVELIRRAKATGHLRQDFASEDFVLLLLANAGLLAATASDAPSGSPRLVAQVLRGVAAPGAPLPPMPPAPSSADLYQALIRTRTAGPPPTTDD